MSLNVNEIGKPIRINAGKDISSSTPTLILIPEFGIPQEITSGVTIPAVDVTVDNEIYHANEYIEYLTIEDTLDYAGRWKKQAELYFSASNVEKTNLTRFRVLA
jgi:hypothetical protein